MKGFALVNCKRSEHLPPHQKRNERDCFLGKNNFKDSDGWDHLRLFLGNKPPVLFPSSRFPAVTGSNTE